MGGLGNPNKNTNTKNVMLDQSSLILDTEGNEIRAISMQQPSVEIELKIKKLEKDNHDLQQKNKTLTAEMARSLNQSETSGMLE